MKVRFGLLVALFLLVDSPAAFSQTPTEAVLGPVQYTQDVNGVGVTVSTTSYVRISTVNDTVSLRVRLVADLVDLQRKIGTIVDTFTLPNNNCGSYSPNNPVVGIPRKELRADAEGATFSVGGAVTMWECAQNPVPNSKCDLEVRDIGFHIKTKVPVCKTWPGNPIKTIIATQPFDADLPVFLVKNNDHAVGIQFSKPDIELKGQYAFITKGILKVAGIDINQKAYDALQKAIDPSKLIQTIPAELRHYNLIVDDAKMYNDAGHLSAEIVLSASIPASGLTNLLEQLMQKK